MNIVHLPHTNEYRFQYIGIRCKNLTFEIFWYFQI